MLALDSALMLKALAGGVFAGEMLDWESATGGTLLGPPVFASGRQAGRRN